jgi:adenylate kinase family enzyme
MDRFEVEAIFAKVKNSLLEYSPACAVPVACILGGQPSSGKSYLNKAIENQNRKIDFLPINGDLYRVFHPEYEKLVADVANFSRATQIFSNVFTEKLIESSIEKRLNVIVEGTMRNVEVPLKTAKMYKNAGFRTEVYLIAAPAEFTEIGIFHRFQKEMEKNGIGRLAELSAHNAAVSGLLVSADELYKQKAVDKIVIYSYLAETKVAEYECDGKNWNNSILPSKIIEEARRKQLSDKKMLAAMIKIGEQTLHEISKEFQPDLFRSLKALAAKLL